MLYHMHDTCDGLNLININYQKRLIPKICAKRVFKHCGETVLVTIVSILIDMPYRFRNRDDIKAPVRYHSPGGEVRQVSYEELDVDQEIDASSPKSSTLRYREPLILVNSDLPHGAFPKFKVPRKAHTPEHEIHDLVSPSASDTEAIDFDSSRITKAPSASKFGRSEGGRPLSNPNHDVHRHNYRHVVHPHNTTGPDGRIASIVRPLSYRQPVGAPGTISSTTMDSVQRQRALLRPFHDGTSRSILRDNMRRLDYAGNISDHDNNILDMLTSDEDDEVQKSPDDGSPAWDNLATVHKVQLYDVVADAYPNYTATRKLRLDNSQVQRLRELLILREERMMRENADAEKHRRNIHQRLMRGAIMNQERFRKSLEDNLYGSLRDDCGESDLDHATISSFEEAKAYLRYCGLDPNLLHGVWVDASAESQVQWESASTRCQTSESNGVPLHPIPLEGSILPTKIPSPPSQQVSPSSCQDSDGEQRKLNEGQSSSGKRLSLVGRHRPSLRLSIPLSQDLSRMSRNMQIEATSSNHTPFKTPELPRTPTIPKTPNTPRTPDTPTKRLTTDKEAVFLSSLIHERRPGARQTRLSKKAAAATGAGQARKSRTSGDSIEDSITSASPAQSLASAITGAAASKKRASDSTKIKHTRFEESAKLVLASPTSPLSKTFSEQLKKKLRGTGYGACETPVQSTASPSTTQGRQLFLSRQSPSTPRPALSP